MALAILQPTIDLKSQFAEIMTPLAWAMHILTGAKIALDVRPNHIKIQQSPYVGLPYSTQEAKAGWFLMATGWSHLLHTDSLNWPVVPSLGFRVAFPQKL